MELTDPITVNRETLEISGGRKLYNYTFEIAPETSENLADSGGEEPNSGNLNPEAQTKG
ncbi:MAG TPA: hypothetical protein VEX38_00090 [Fimbriimonadaceae bacterium]|nr:hypothetical protein [Fimbriimonadaceae bacterium]